MTELGWGDRLWARLLDPPFHAHGDRLLAGLLGASVLLGGAFLAGTHLDEVLASGENAFTGLLAGAMIGGMVGLASLAASAALRRLLGPRGSRLVVGLALLALAGAVVSAWVQPLWSSDPRISTGGGGRVGEIAGALAATAAVILFGLFQIVLAWVARLRDVVDAPSQGERASDGPWLGGAVVRCSSCDRLSMRRWRHCWFCAGLLPGAGRYRPDAEATLTLLAWVGVLVGGVLSLAALNLYVDGERVFALVAGALSLAFVGLHALLKWWPAAFTPARIAWGVLALCAALPLWRTPLLALFASALPIAISLELWHLGRGLADYLHGVPSDRLVPDEFDGYLCRVCGDAGAEIAAPLWCVSFVVLTMKRPGRPALRCPWHARAAALPATFVSALVGWWGIPWGILWTPMVLWQNLTNGGVSLTRSAALELVEEEGPLAIDPRHVLLFVVSIGIIAVAAIQFR